VQREGLSNSTGIEDATEMAAQDYFNKNLSYDFIDYHYNSLNKEEYRSFLRESEIQITGFRSEEFLRAKPKDYMNAISCYRKYFYDNFIFPIRNHEKIGEAKRLVNMYFAFLEAVYLYDQCYPENKNQYAAIYPQKAPLKEMKLYKILFESHDKGHSNTFY